MSFRFSADSKRNQTLVRGRLKRLAGRTARYAPDLARVSKLKLGAFHPVYDLRLDALAAGGGLDGLKPSSLRYLITNAAGKALGSAELRPRAGKLMLANLNFGRLVGASATAFDKLATNVQVIRGGYEARLLRCAALYIYAVWLKADDGVSDIIYPVENSVNGLAIRAYSVSEFLTAVRALAKKRLTGPKLVSPPRV